MNGAAQRLLDAGADRWRQLGEYLAREDAVLLADADRRAFRREWDEITGKESLLDDCLTIGLVGGTGVGKSTFINALAHAEISRCSDRRPTTDRIVVYRHLRSAWPAGVPTTELSRPPVLHENPFLERIILLDFPDFDSADATHAETLQRYLPHLDVLFVLVDDMKYGDRRLFDLLASVSHDPGNLFALLNKVDLLERRYGPRWPQVAGSILEDLRRKIEAHGGFSLPASQTVAISARGRFLNATLGEADRAEGDFSSVERILDGYREAKRRRAAKELNLVSRREGLSASIRTAALAPERFETIDAAAELIGVREEELRRVGETISGEILTEGERRSLRCQHLRRAAPAWGFPFSFIWRIGSLLPGRGRREPARALSGLAERVRVHYEAYLDGLVNLQTALELDLATLGIAGCDREVPSRGSGGRPEERSGPSPRELTAELGARLQKGLAPELPPSSTRRRWAFHLPALGLLLLALWSLFYPLLRHLVAGEESGGSTAGALLRILLRGLHPLLIAGWIAALILVYAATTLALWSREAGRLDESIFRAEDGVRESVIDHGRRVLEDARRRVLEFRRERDALEEWLRRE
ncbi:MAG: 50S ribosome-binding GTPase [Planctomycetes bacterium]|nr:50S ribosome-binding GTPase [Planctomycetota bacterium]